MTHTLARTLAGVMFLASAASGATGAASQPGRPGRNRPALDLPIASRKLVVAHYMTHMLYYRGVRTGHNWDPAMYWPNGPAAKLGGLIQHYPMTVPFRTTRSLEESVEFEMRAAKRLGVDGFQFFYPCPPNDAFMAHCGRIIRAFFRVAAARKLDFKLTLCLCSPDEGTQKRKTDFWVKHIGEILSKHRDSPHWLRRPDGRNVFFLWCPDALTDRLPHHWQVKDNPRRVADVADAYEDLARRLSLRIAYVYHLRWPNDRAHLRAVLDNFPAVWGWTDSYATDDGWERVAAGCKARKRDYTQTVYPDYYTSKLYPHRKNAPMLFRLEEALAIGRENTERQIQVCRLSYVFRQLLARAVRTDAALINLVTWNDYPEGHHLAPEINHNFGFALLLKHYKGIWQGRTRGVRRESAIVFYKKYRHDIVPKPFDFHRRIKRAVGPEKLEDGIEVVTILNAPADLFVNGRPCGPVGTGLVATTAPMAPGPVRVGVRRGGKTVLGFTAPEWITDRPYRTDRLTYCYSSQFGRIYRDLFADAKPMVSDEYAEDKPGVPNWRER
jgi:hypothetical protein